MAYGITPAGFIKKPANVIKSELEDEYRAIYGTVDVSPESPIGLLIGMDLKRELDFWDIAESIYLSRYPRSASGVSLDRTLQYNGLSRLESLPSTVIALLMGDNNTTVPAGTQVSIAGIDKVFTNAIETSILNTSCCEIKLHIENFSNIHNYSVTIDGNTYSSTGSTSAIVLDAIADAINAANISNLVAAYSSEELTIYNNTYIFTFSIIVDSELTVNYYGTPCVFTAIENGATPIPIGSFTQLVRSVPGLTGVINRLAGSIGRNIESDSALRIRREKSLLIRGGASPDAISSRIIQEVEGVSDSQTLYNSTDIVDNEGRPPHSVEVLVFGGTDEAVAAKVFELTAAGIQTVGEILRTVTDQKGVAHQVRFSRPTPRYIWIRVTITEDTETTFPIGGETALKTAIVNYCRSIFTNSLDVIAQKIYVPVYSIRGIRSATIELAVTTLPNGTPTYSTNNIVLTSRYYSQFDENRVVIVI